MRASLLFLPLVTRLVSASPRLSLPNPIREPPVTSTSLPYDEAVSLNELRKRQTTAFSSTATSSSPCGYVSGNANSPVVPGPGSTCALIQGFALWRICPSDIEAGHVGCMLPSGCVDNNYCSQGCIVVNAEGQTNTNDPYTLTCTASGADACGASLLIWEDTISLNSLLCTTATGSGPPIFTVEASATFTPSSSTSSSESTTSTSPTASSSSTSASNTSSPTPTSTTASTQAQTSIPPSSSGSSPKTKVLAGVLVPILFLALLGAALVIMRYRLNHRKRDSEALGAGGAGGMEAEKRESEAFIPREPVELSADKHISELEAVSKSPEVNAISSPVELVIGHEDHEDHEDGGHEDGA